MTSSKQIFSDRLTTSNAPTETNFTLQEIADTMGLTKERIRQIESKALNKLRQRLCALGHNQANLLNH